jgi:hypothetical protein
MELERAIEARYGFSLPASYRALQAEGRFAAGSENWLHLTDLEWLGLRDIAAYQFEDWQLAAAGHFVPFAISARRDEWCWRLDWANGGEPPVVFLERGPEGYGYAPDFRGFLYRVLLEELSGSWLLQDETDEHGQALVWQSVNTVTPFLPEAWAARLRDLAARPWYKDKSGAIRVFPRTECKQIVAEELKFPHLNEYFMQEAPRR